MVVDTLIRQLLEAGVHFGHQTKRWNPKMNKFIFGQRSGIYIIDLQKTAKRLKAASEFLQTLAASGKNVLFVGTKKQAQEIITFEATRCGMFYVNQRWLGGTLTNFQTIRKSINRLKDLQNLKNPESHAALTKKEKAVLDKEVAGLSKKFSGIAQMESLPAALIIVDPKNEETAFKEAKRLNVPVVALLDTNCDPEEITYPIPGNDDAIRAIKLVVSLLADSVLAGRQAYLAGKQAEVQKQKEEQEAKETAEKTPLKEVEELIIEDIEKKTKEPEPLIRKKPKIEGKKK